VLPPLRNTAEQPRSLSEHEASWVHWIMKLFKKRRETDVFVGGEEAPAHEERRWHMRARVLMAVALVVITILDWYIINYVLSSNPSTWYTIYAVLLTIHIGWIMVAMAILSPS
jgi:hypothetical protein